MKEYLFSCLFEKEIKGIFWLINYVYRKRRKIECFDVFRNIWLILYNFYNSVKKINMLNEL